MLNKKPSLDANYWNDRYLNNETGWDIGSISTPLKNYFDQLEDKSIRILIPGAGNAHETTYLHELGFQNVFLLDFAQQPLENFKTKHPDLPSEHLICDDFFNHTGAYDLIVEQTFFCALNPNLREQYVNQMLTLLEPNGKLVGLLFNDELPGNNPPFGGSLEEYNTLFSNNFTINVMEMAYNSIKPRHDRELFINLSPKTA